MYDLIVSKLKRCGWTSEHRLVVRAGWKQFVREGESRIGRRGRWGWVYGLKYIWLRRVWAVLIGRRSGGGRVLIWEVQKRKETPGALRRPPSFSLSTEINCTATNSPWEASQCVHMWYSSSRVYFRLCVCICICVCGCVRICVCRAAWRLPVCRRFIGEADEQGRYPGAAWQWPELYLSWNDFSTPFWSTNPGAMSPPPPPPHPSPYPFLLPSFFLCHFVIFSSATYSLVPSPHLSCLFLSLAATGD